MVQIYQPKSNTYSAEKRNGMMCVNKRKLFKSLGEKKRKEQQQKQTKINKQTKQNRKRTNKTKNNNTHAD